MPHSDEIIYKTKRWVKIISIVSGGLMAILTPMIVMYVEVKPQVIKAQKGAESGYEAIVPAIIEIQGILNDSTDWAKDVDLNINQMRTSQNEINNRLIRCETYMEMLSNRRGTRPIPVPPVPSPPEPMAITGEPFIDDAPVQKKATYEMPKDLKEAKAKVQSRNSSGCSPNDPLCGEL